MSVYQACNSCRGSFCCCAVGLFCAFKNDVLIEFAAKSEYYASSSGEALLIIYIYFIKAMDF